MELPDYWKELTPTSLMEIGVPETPILFTMLWVGDGDELPDQVKLGLKSYLDYGHKIQLFTYKPWTGIPEGVIVRNANVIISEENIFTDCDHKSLAPFADWFRWEFLYREGGFWVDVDQVCISPKVPTGPIYYCTQSQDKMNTGIGALKFPKGDPFINELRQIANDPAYIAPWYESNFASTSDFLLRSYPNIKERRRHIFWGFGGPRAMSQGLLWLGDYHKLAAPYDMTIAIAYRWWFRYFDGVWTPDMYRHHISDYTWSIHWWEEMWKHQFPFTSFKKNSVIEAWWNDHFVLDYRRKMKCIAIIPAKGTSSRVPGKNLRVFNDEPLFMHSVHYAQEEGAEPVVSTDSQEIIQLCMRCGIRYVEETVDESSMVNCVRQVLEQVPCEAFAVLQPTSPLRKPHMLAEMFNLLVAGEAESAYTYHDVKVIGHLGEEFKMAYRDQDTKVKLQHFDGNILVATRKFFERTKALFDNKSRPVKNIYPCNQQIDSEEEFNALEYLSHSPQCCDYLPKLRTPKKIAIISNRIWFTRDYSQFIDSCDKVIRVSKMENLKMGLTGKRTDFAVVNPNQPYSCFSYEGKNVDELKKCSHVWFVDANRDWLFQFVHHYQFEHWGMIPEEVTEKCAQNFTTLGRAIELAHWLYPEAHLYIVGDSKSEIRTDHHGWHSTGNENARHEYLEQIGVLTWVLEEDGEPEGGYKYSREISEEKKKAMEASGFNALWLARWGPEFIEHESIFVDQGTWQAELRIIGDEGCRVTTSDTFKILERTDTSIKVKWKLYGEETFVLDPETQTYKLQKEESPAAEEDEKKEETTEEPEKNDE